MCDTEIHSNKQICFIAEKALLENQKKDSLWYLAFWSNPAWIDLNHSLSTAATNYWAMYHRMSIALSRVGVTEVLRSVKNVIPNSKLATYGDYSYNIDYEDMCCLAEDVQLNYYAFKCEENMEWPDIKTNNPIHHSYFNSTFVTKEKTDPCYSKRSRDDWLRMLKNVLNNVRQLANEAHLLDSWTETLLKTCLRFICVARTNETFTKLLDSEISFIIDYEQILKLPISKLEFLSIPQPENKADSNLDIKTIDALWMKLSSRCIRKLWYHDTALPFNIDPQDNSHLIPLMKINFLRRRQQPKSIDSSAQHVVVPENMELKLLGSLLHVINETHVRTRVTPNIADVKPRNHFPEAHGEWTKHLFPHRVDSGSIFEREVAMKKEWNCNNKSQFLESTSKIDHSTFENMKMPLRYYMPVPLPTVSPSVSLPLVRQSYIYNQPRSGMMLMSANNITSSHSAQHFKVPTVPVTGVSSLMFASTATPSVNINYNLPLRFTTPVPAVTAVQYPKMNAAREPHLKYTTETQKFHSKMDEKFNWESISQKSENRLILQEHKIVPENAVLRNLNDNSSLTRSVTQPTHECNMPIKQAARNTNGNRNNIPQSVLYERYIQQTLPTNIHVMKSTSQLKVREPWMTSKPNYPTVSYRFPKPLQKTFPQGSSQNLSQFSLKPRYVCAVNINDVRRAQEKLFYQKYKYDWLKRPSDQHIEKNISTEDFALNGRDACLGYEVKVEKWLETVNKYVKCGSFNNLKDLRDPLYPEISDNFGKFNVNGIGDCSELEEWRSENTFQNKSIQNGVKVPSKICSYIDETSYANKNILTTCKKKNAKKFLLKHSPMFYNFVLRLKKDKYIVNKIKLIKKIFTEINLKGSQKFDSKHSLKIIKMECFSGNSCLQSKKKKVSVKKKSCSSLGLKPDNLHYQLDNYFDSYKSNLLINDISDFKVLIREGHEFNAFPSKRMKITNSLSLIYDKETFIRDEQSFRICSLNYFDKEIDKLFFQNYEIEEIDKWIQGKSVNPEIVNGWTHFKVGVKTAMKNIINSLHANYSDEVMKIR